MIIETFVNQLTAKYNTKELADICIVVPNNRAKLYIRKELINAINNYAVLPQLLSIQDFMQITASLINKIEIADNLTLILKLYEVHKNIYKTADNAGDSPSFRAFLTLAYTILRDFNDLDLYLADTDRAFKYINEEKTLSMWGIDMNKLSDAESTYIKYFNFLKDYYKNFKEELFSENLGYTGQVYRIVAENIDQIIEKLEWNKVFFVGFSALTNSEIVIFDKLYKSGKAEMVWDVDSYYIYSPQINKNDDNIQEAGIFLRRYYYNKIRSLDYISPEFKPIKFDGWKETFPKEIPNNFLEKPKNINVVCSPGDFQQAQIVGEILTKNQYKTGETAIILADENLLLPVLSYIPDKYDSINVSMGVPISGSNISSLVENLFLLYDSYNTKNFAFYNTKYLLNIFLNPIFNDLFINADDLKAKIVEQNQYDQISLQTFKASFDSAISDGDLKKMFSILFENNNEQTKINTAIVIDKINYFLNVFIEKYAEDINYLVDIEVALSFVKTLNNIKQKISDYDYLNDLKNFLVIYQNILKEISVSFKGDPFQALQILGILETRLLNFKNLIIVSVNEGVLPKVNFQNTFLPYELSMAIGMPGRKEKEGIFAYHFYRLLQNAENIHLIYNATIEDFGANEKSRFILQIQHEIDNYKNNITFKNEEHIDNKYNIVNKISDLNTLSEKKSENLAGINVTSEIREVVDDFFSKYSLSASSFNIYLRCQAMFFYTEILGLKDESKGKDNSGVLIGSITHKVLEELYTTFCDTKDDSNKSNLKLTVEKLDNIDSVTINNQIIKAFKDENIDPSIGLNVLMRELIAQYIVKMINTDKTFLLSGDKDNNYNTLEIQYLEKSLEINPILEGNKYTIKGFLDRVERANGQLVIMDYKTGSFDSNITEINAEEFFEKLKEDEIDLDYFAFKKSSDINQYIVQLLNYAYLYFKDNTKLTKGKDKHIKLGIYALKHHDHSANIDSTNDENIIKKLLLVKKDNDDTKKSTELITEQDINLFEKLLVTFLKTLKEQSCFKYTDQYGICELCDFNTICKGSKCK
ncbi:MAG: PD-(D/E)XK nuclease family protein [Bacteroidales bacterium]|jgi:ATP-dependent helicase/nuclease subunit B